MKIATYILVLASMISCSTMEGLFRESSKYVTIHLPNQNDSKEGLISSPVQPYPTQESNRMCFIWSSDLSLIDTFQIENREIIQSRPLSNLPKSHSFKLHYIDTSRYLDMENFIEHIKVTERLIPISIINPK